MLRIGWLFLLAVAVFLGGCAGSSDNGGPTGPGSLLASAVFDPIDRNLPGYAASLRLTITLQGSSTNLDPVLIARPGDDGGEASQTISNLPAGRHILQAEALSNDGRVVAVAQNVGFLIRSQETTPLRFSSGLASTIDRVEIDNAEQLENPGIDVSMPPTQLGCRAVDRNGDVLLINPGNGFRWSCDNDAVAEITVGGVITPIGAGTANLTVQLQTSDGLKRKTVPLRVTGPTGLAGFKVEWGPVTVNKSVPGYVKSLVATLIRNGVTLGTATINRRAGNDAYFEDATFPGEFAAGTNYRIEIQARNRSEGIVGTATLTNVIVPFSQENAQLVSTLNAPIDQLVIFQSDQSGIGTGRQLQNGETVTMNVGQTLRFRGEGRRGGIPSLSHQDIAFTVPLNSQIRLTDARAECTIEALASGSVTVTATADGGPSATMVIQVN